MFRMWCKGQFNDHIDKFERLTLTMTTLRSGASVTPKPHGVRRSDRAIRTVTRSIAVWNHKHRESLVKSQVENIFIARESRYWSPTGIIALHSWKVGRLCQKREIKRLPKSENWQDRGGQKEVREYLKSWREMRKINESQREGKCM